MDHKSRYGAKEESKEETQLRNLKDKERIARREKKSGTVNAQSQAVTSSWSLVVSNAWSCPQASGDLVKRLVLEPKILP